MRSQTSLTIPNFGQGAITALGITWLLFLAAEGVVSRSLTMGDLVLINAFLLQLFIPMNFLGFVYREIKHSLADMEKMFKLLDENPAIRDKAGAQPLAVGGGGIRFEEVDFGYGSRRQILFDTDFEVPAGHKVAVVGASGGGKSTLVRLLFRFYDIDSGRILNAIFEPDR